MCWTNALKPTPSPSTPNSPAWWAGKGCRGCSHPAFGETGEGTGPGRTGTPLLHSGRSSGYRPRLPHHCVPWRGPGSSPDASLFAMRPFRCLALDLINSPLVSFSENEIGSAWEITRNRQLLWVLLWELWVGKRGFGSWWGRWVNPGAAPEPGDKALLLLPPLEGACRERHTSKAPRSKSYLFPWPRNLQGLAQSTLPLPPTFNLSTMAWLFPPPGTLFRSFLSADIAARRRRYSDPDSPLVRVSTMLWLSDKLLFTYLLCVECLPY